MAIETPNLSTSFDATKHKRNVLALRDWAPIVSRQQTITVGFGSTGAGAAGQVESTNGFAAGMGYVLPWNCAIIAMSAVINAAVAFNLEFALYSGGGLIVDYATCVITAGAVSGYIGYDQLAVLPAGSIITVARSVGAGGGGRAGEMVHVVFLRTG